ncbi:hypothetical protein H6776_01120 [Candidatus Nomurabacteria bacterium]|nr:hypothetical protein [Candidatus Nomurabacteria bacterium]
MSTISVPLTPELEEFIEQQLRENRFSNKAELVRRALYEFSEQLAIRDVIEAQQEARSGGGIAGDLETIIESMID